MTFFDKAEVEGTFARRFRRVVESAPGRTAVRTPDATLTYSELDSSSDAIARAILPRRVGGEPIPTRSLPYARRLHRKAAHKNREIRSEASLLADATIAAHRLLQQGAKVQVIPDIGYNSADGMPLDIAGFHFLVKPGFADLALLSQAVVIPQYTTRRAGGCIHTCFEPPLDPGHAGQDRQTRIALLLDQYAVFVETAWRKAPESLLWPVIDTRLFRPKAAA